MAKDLPLRCHCGRVRGAAREAGPRTGLRLICYCEHCQQFARFLGRSDILDDAGGTDIFQMPPGRVNLTQGADALRCVSLSDKGVLRWYSECCKTPIANSAAKAGFPVIGVIHSIMDHENDGRSRDEALGPVFCRLFEQSALHPLAPMKSPPWWDILARRSSLLIGWQLKGLAQPSPFFDERTGAPIAEPTQLRS